VLVIDLDDFKAANDTLGHAVGDDLLQRVAERLRSVLRDHDTPARIGGDEFAVLLEDLQEPAEAVWIAERVLEVLRVPYTLLAGQPHTTASIGVALSVAGSESAEELIHNADLAMYQAKTAGGNRIEAFRPQMHAAMVERQVLEADLRTALIEDALFLQYQPLVHLDSGSVYGFEALARWEHPDRGLVPPMVFIPIAEESGQIFQLGRWVLAEACAQATTWPDVGGEPLILAVNVSARQLVDPNFPGIVSRTLTESGLRPERLLLEITEGVLARDGVLAVRQLSALKALGISVAVDDFGTGYSSLSRLRTLPVDVIKIDKSFIDGVASTDGAFVTAILRLAADIDVRTVAEGVERPEQSEALLRLGCRDAQGSLFGRPLDAEAVVGFLAHVGVAETPFSHAGW
jgi:diguanylate cyclase (GGDEF)-like protein